jgi:hypothetical protein
MDGVSSTFNITLVDEIMHGKKCEACYTEESQRFALG